MLSSGLPALDQLVTEQRNPRAAQIDQASTAELLAIVNSEDQTVASAVAQQIPAIAAAVDAIVKRYEQGGRLIYVGSGTSGRLGILDAAECPPTYGVDPSRVTALIAGGPAAILRAQEGAEDNLEQGGRDLANHALTAQDAVVGISASGRTPYVLGALRYARRHGALTVSLSCQPDSEIAAAAELAITPVVGPEVVTGSTRMKAGTAQKLVLNMLSTALMVKMGYVLGNLMVNVRLTNEKLWARGRRLVREVAGCSDLEAAQALDAAQDVRVAILMLSFGIDPETARGKLQNAGDNLRKALAK